MRKSQKIVVVFEGIKVETTVGALIPELIPLFNKLYDTTAKWQGEGFGTPPSVSVVIKGYCVSATWHGKAPACKPRIKEIMGIGTEDFLSKQYKP